MKVKTAHQHQVNRWYSLPFTECVAPDHCVPQAHGNIIDLITCACGAMRRSNINRGYREIGPWEEMVPAEEV
jgi:hypothetical protein